MNLALDGGSSQYSNHVESSEKGIAREIEVDIKFIHCFYLNGRAGKESVEIRRSRIERGDVEKEVLEMRRIMRLQLDSRIEIKRARKSCMKIWQTFWMN